MAEPYAVWSSVIPAYEKAGVKIIPEGAGPVPISSTVPAEVSDDNSAQQDAKLLADWFITDSGGKGHALLWGVPQLGVLKVFDDMFRPTVAQACSACKVTYLAEPFAAVAAGQNVSAIVSAVQRDRSIKYVITDEQALNTPLAGALKAAGITGIKIGGPEIEAADETLIKSGNEAVGIPDALNIVGWMFIDAALRVSEHMPAVSEDITPTLLTPSNPFTPSDSFNYPSDWQQRFKQLWHVG